MCAGPDFLCLTYRQCVLGRKKARKGASFYLLTRADHRRGVDTCVKGTEFVMRKNGLIFFLMLC